MFYFNFLCFFHNTMILKHFIANKGRRLTHTVRRYYVCNSNKSLNLWHEELDTKVKLKIEEYWRNEVLHKNIGKHNEKFFYVLPMFPYPSGNLHMGHVRVYSISDTIARFQNLCGNNVIHPIGWDAFGLPAENAAIERKVQPQEWTQMNIKAMKEQLLKLSFNFDWNREISTCDSQYYKWTQLIFLKLCENGLVYRKKATVNWDPVDKTVLADEQVDDSGCSWRSGAKVEKKVLTQWFIKTTRYAKQLYDGLKSDSLVNWNDIINLQRHWIGECNGVAVNFELYVNEHKDQANLEIWTDQPYKLLHANFITIKKNNIVVQEILEGKDITDINFTVFNPISGLKVPVHITDEANYPESRDIYLASPSTDIKDRELALLLNIPFDCKSPVNDAHLEKDSKKAIEIAQKKNVGGHFVSSTLRDWLISRQRYWGTPIPIIHCQVCGTVPVPKEDLPVTLPEKQIFSANDGGLDTIESWINCKCPKCSGPAKRETDTMDTFVDSSWYYYRFLDPHNDNEPFDKHKLKGLTPVHLYIGGKEHAVLHLYYARFMSYFLHSINWTLSPEPFEKLIVQGMVMGQSYKLKSSGKYISSNMVNKIGDVYKEKGTDEPLVVQWEKMSKSKYNGENPENLLSSYGCDTTRLFILADVPPATSRNWSETTFPGVLNWQKRLWLSMREFLKERSNSLNYENPDLTENLKVVERKLWDSRNYFIANTTYHFKHTHKLSIGISRLQGLTNTLRNKLPPEIIAKSGEFELALASLIIMLSPIAPHFCSELWAGLRSAENRILNNSPLIDWNKNVFQQKWPSVDENYELSFSCKVDGVDRCDLKVKARDLAELTEETALQIMEKQSTINKWLKRGIKSVKFKSFPESRAMLYIFTNKKQKEKIAEQN